MPEIRKRSLEGKRLRGVTVDFVDNRNRLLYLPIRNFGFEIEEHRDS